MLKAVADINLTLVPQKTRVISLTTTYQTKPLHTESDAPSDAALPLYARHFGLKNTPFSIAPDPRYLYMSERHREALAHLLYGLQGGGGFVLLTGEIGSGKTTVCRCMLEQVPPHCNVAYIFNPKLTAAELLETVCDEFNIPHTEAGSSLKAHVDALNAYLLRTHAQGEIAVLVIDEAQNLSPEVLEQLRLLTNLETNERKLLQIVLVGQPELRTMIAGAGLEQLAQRVIARYHLEALSAEDSQRYIEHRLRIAGLSGSQPFERRAFKRLMHHARGIARRINLLCDRALLGAYAEGHASISARIVDKAASEAFGAETPAANGHHWSWKGIATSFAVTIALAAGIPLWRHSTKPVPVQIRKVPTVKTHSAPSAHPVSAALPPATWLKAEELRTLILPSDEVVAWRELASLWGLTLKEGDPCLAAKQSGVRCFRDRASNLDRIRQLGRPGVLTLYDDRQQAHHVLLVALGKQEARLLVQGGAGLRVALASLAPLWRGEFATLWRAPSGYANVAGDIEPGPAAETITARLTELAHKSPELAGHPVDSSLKTMIAAFQFAQGLRPDGKAGPITLMLLNRFSDISEPRLKSER